MSTTDIPLFPVAGWTIGPIPAYEALTIKFDFLSSPMQDPASASPGRHYLLTPAQASELVQQIQSALQKLQTAGFQPPPGDRH